MSDRPMDPGSSAPGAAPGTADLPPPLRSFLLAPTSRLLLVRGPIGSGKSVLARSLAQVLPGRVIVARPGQRPETFTDGAVEGGTAPGARTAGAERPDRLGPTLAASAFHDSDGSAAPEWLERLVGELPSDAHSYLLLDNWLLPSGGHTEGAGTHGPQDRELQLSSLKSLLDRSRLHIVLFEEGTGPSEGVSSADGLVETSFESLSEGSVRILTLRKLAGGSGGLPRYPYTLADGRFRCLLPLPPESRPPAAEPDPAPEERAGFTWPGSAEFARAFGWLRHGTLSGVELDRSVPDEVAFALNVPVAAHVLRSGGRVVWVPMASILPERALETLARWIPMESLRERLRILSAAGDEESTLGLRGILIPLSGAPAATGPPAQRRVAPAFQEAFRFLQANEPERPALFLLSVEGLLALATVTGITYDPATFPLILSQYARLPRFHGLGIGRIDDPLSAAARSGSERLLRIEGRADAIFVTSVRPRSVPYALRWSDDTPRYQLVPME